MTSPAECECFVVGREEQEESYNYWSCTYYTLYFNDAAAGRGKRRRRRGQFKGRSMASALQTIINQFLFPTATRGKVSKQFENYSHPLRRETRRRISRAE